MRALYAYIMKLEAILAAPLLLLMVGLIFLGGVARLMAHPLNWTIGLATCCFAWSCFLCADIAWRNDALMSINLIGGRLPKFQQSLLVYANYLIISTFLTFLIFAGVWLPWVSRARSYQGIPGVSYSWISMSLPVGAALILITTLIKVRDQIHADRGSTAPGPPAGTG